MRIYWTVVVALFLTLPVSFAATIIGTFFGCDNYFELGCAPGIGSIFGATGTILAFVSLITLPLAFILLFVGIVLTEVKRRRGGRLK